MKSIVHDFEEYLRNTLGISATPVAWESAQRLPMYLRELYRFYQADFFDTHCLLMVSRDREEKTPATVCKHMTQVQEKWDGEVIFVDAVVSSHNRKRLIEHKVPFVIPGNQMYLPLLGIDLREHFRKLRHVRPLFSPSTQVLVLQAIYQGKDCMCTPSEIAQQLGYSAMTLSRAFDELESVGIGEHSVRGKERHLHFLESRKELWEKTQPFMRKPARKVVSVLFKDGPPEAMQAGLSALAHYSMLAEPKNPVFAFTAAEWKSWSSQRTITELTAPEPGSLEIELWSYSPAQFATNGFIDRLSLYLSLRDTNDERIEMALEQMMESIQW